MISNTYKSILIKKCFGKYFVIGSYSKNISKKFKYRSQEYLPLVFKILTKSICLHCLGCFTGKFVFLCITLPKIGYNRFEGHHFFKYDGHGPFLVLK